MTRAKSHATQWHRRYLQQARWTESLRRYLFEKTGLAAARRVLEVGCGSGALLGQLPVQANAAIHGLDLNLSAVMEAAHAAPSASLLCADGAQLPYAPASFDITFCHFVLMWAERPAELVREMRRVTRPGGAVFALAEPDYENRIDHPAALVTLGGLQTQSLRQQGADTRMGRKLAGLFAGAGFQHVETGVLGGEWAAPPTLAERESEWAALQSDLTGTIHPSDLQKLKEIEAQAYQNGERVLFVPTFFAWGRV